MDIYYFHPDHLGSSSYITNMAGMVSQHMEYLPFGELLVDEHKNSYNSPFKYNGKEFDEETGNYFYGARYYDPKWSIFISVDPSAEKHPSWTPYHYVHNNPIIYTDPDGKDAILTIKGNTVTISATVIATNSKEAQMMMQKAADNYYNNKNFTGTIGDKSYNVQFDIKVVSFEQAQAQGILSNDDVNFMTHRPNSDKDNRSYVSDFRDMTIIGNANERTYAHEMGHLLGLADRYIDLKHINTGEVVSYPFKTNNPQDIMGKGDRIVPESINALLEFGLKNQKDGKIIINNQSVIEGIYGPSEKDWMDYSNKAGYRIYQPEKEK
ncbi:MAG TPA: RHS repeat-associated core domain-containing protein [Flavobacterium sp.]|nr:RHS repeat-associated core domain-containing protein [Flavobacterium sp.]